MVNDPLMDEERNREKKQSQVIKPADNFIPYDPNTDEERSSGESFNSGLTLPPQNPPKVDPIDYKLEKPSDPTAEISPAQSYQLNPVEIQEFREEELLKPPAIKSGENPYYINEEAGIINPRELDKLETRTESFMQDADMLDRQITEFNNTYDEFASDIDKDTEELNEEFKQIDFLYENTSNRDNEFWNEYNTRWDAAELKDKELDKKVDMFNTFYDANTPFLDDREASVKMRERYIIRDWDAIGDEFELPPEISSGDIYDRDLPQYSFYLEGPGDIYDRDIPKFPTKEDIQFTDPSLENPITFYNPEITKEDIQFTDRSLEAPGEEIIEERDINFADINLEENYQNTFRAKEIFKPELDSSLEVPESVYESRSFFDRAKNNITGFELGSIVGKGDSALSPTVGGVGRAGQVAASGAWILSGADYLLDQAKNIPNLRVFNPEGFTEDEVKDGSFIDKARNVSDLDDYLVSFTGQVERGINIIPIPVYKDTDGDGEKELTWKSIQRDDPTSYGALRMADEKRMDLPFGDISFASQENLDTLRETEGKSGNPFDEDFDERRFGALATDKFRPVDLALTLTQLKILGSLVKGGANYGVRGIKNSGQILNSGKRIVQNNIPDNMLTAQQIVNKAYYKAYKGSDDITKKIDDVQEDIEKVLDGQRIGSWISRKPSPQLIKKLEDLQLEIANSTRKNNISKFRGKISAKIRDGNATKKEREVADILENLQKDQVVIAEAKSIDRGFKYTDGLGPFGKEMPKLVKETDDLSQLKENLNYVEKRFPNLAGTPQSEELAKKLTSGTVTGKLFDDAGGLGAAKLNPDVFRNPKVMAEIEANIIKAQELIDAKKRLPDGRYGQELLRDTVENADAQYKALYKLDDLYTDGKFDYDKLDEWLNITWKPGNKYRAFVDDAYGKNKGSVLRDSDNPFFKVTGTKISSENQGGGSQNLPDGNFKTGKGSPEGNKPASEKLESQITNLEGPKGKGIKGINDPEDSKSSTGKNKMPAPKDIPDKPDPKDSPETDPKDSPEGEKGDKGKSEGGKGKNKPDPKDSPETEKGDEGKADGNKAKKGDEGKAEGGKGKKKSKTKGDDGKIKRKGKKGKPSKTKVKQKAKGKKVKRKKVKKIIRLGDGADNIVTPDLDVDSQSIKPKRFAAKIQWKENNKYYQFDFNNKKITRSDDPVGSGVKKGKTPSETVKIIKRQSRKPRYQKAILGRIEIRLQSPNSVALKNLPNYKTITKVSNFKK